MMRRSLITVSLLAMLLGFTVAAFAQTSSDYFLHGTGPDNNPPTLLLNTTASTATNCPVRLSGRAMWLDSPSIFPVIEPISSR